MGTGCRIIRVNEVDFPQRISMVRLDRVLHFDRAESLPEYAGNGYIVRWHFGKRNCRFLCRGDLFFRNPSWLPFQ